MHSGQDLVGSRFVGQYELWTDPLGDVAQSGPCSISVDANAFDYQWELDGEMQSGRVEFAEDGAQFSDTWHQPEPMPCRRIEGGRGLFQVEGCYGPDQDWGWRTQASLRTPTGQLILQMTNIAPWGEEARAVRMTCSPEDESPTVG